MGSLSIAGIALVAYATLGMGQVPSLVPDIAVAEAEFRDAQAAWLQNDPDLEKDLYKGNPEEMRKRIRRAATLREDVMVKKVSYLNLLIQRIQDMRTRLERSSSGAAAIPTESLKKDLESQQSRMLGDQERLESMLRDLPVGDEYTLVRRSMEAERTDLINLQNNIAMRIRSLSTIGKAQSAEQAAKSDPLAPKLDSILKVWEAERASAVRQRAMWTNMYGSMERSLSAKPDPAAPAPSKPAPKPATPGKTWIYKPQPSGWTGYGEPESVTLQLSGESEALTGSYVARLPVRGGVHEVRLNLRGRRQGDTASLKWVSATPVAEGMMKVKFSADGRLLLERTDSSDSFIPRGMEVLVARE